MANGYLRGAFESVVGNEANTPTLSTKKVFFPLTEFEPGLNPSPLDRNDELRNIDEPIAVLPESYEPEWSYNGRAYPDLLGFFLTLALGAPTTTAGDGVITDPSAGVIPATAYRHVWTAPHGGAGVSPKTCQWDIGYVDQGVYLKGKGAATEELSLNSPEEGGVQIEANGPVAYLAKQANPSLSAAYESLAIPPFERGNLTLNPAGPTGTAVTEDFGLSISTPVEIVRSMSIGSKYPDAIEKGEDPIVVSGSMPKRHFDEQDFDALVSAGGFSLMAKWISTANIAATSYPYGLWFEANNAQYVEGGPAALANQRRIGAEYGWEARYGGVAGSTKFTLVNATPNYN
jgi:hypothetical protein